jgi:hypothetical protein
MHRLTLGVAILAAALAGWQALESQSLRAELQAQRSDLVTLAARLDRAEPAAGWEAAPPLRAEAPAAAPEAAGAVEGEGPPLLSSRPVTPQTLVGEVQAMRQRIEEQDRTIAGLREFVERPPQRLPILRASTFVRNVDDLQRVLDLDGHQRAEVERILEDGKRLLADLRSIPNAEGKTWAQASLPRWQQASDDASGVTVLMANVQERARFLASKVPGRDETYGQAEQRIRREGESRLQDLLTPAQRETLRGTHTAHLFGGSGDGDFNVVNFVEGTAVSPPRGN